MSAHKVTMRHISWRTLALWGAPLAIMVAFFGPALWSGRIYYPGDAARLYLPQREVLRRALAQHAWPWWTAKLGAGYPMLAEGEMAAFYPPNWPIALLFSPEVGLTISILAHILWAGMGFFVFARSLGLSRGASFLGGIVLALGGFNIAHLGHVSVLSVAAWWPWLMAGTQHLFTSQGRRLPWGTALGLATAVALQFLAGHAQISLLILLPLAAYALYVGWPTKTRRTLLRWGLWLGALALGALAAAPQLLPGLQLAALSQRAGGLDPAYFTSYSFHPLLLATYLAPFILGNPYPQGSVELMGYVGLLPLALAGIALWQSRHRAKCFAIALGIAGFLLALGRWNPLYLGLRHVPVLNLFRVPARYLYWVTFALATLAALGLDALLQRRKNLARPWRAKILLPAGLVVLLGAALGAVLRAPDVEALIALWRWLPLAFLGALALALLGAQRLPRPLGLILALVTLLVDLYAYGAVLHRTFNITLPRQEVAQPPRSVAFLRQDTSQYRLYTKEEILPILSVAREALYPNMALTWGLASANIYSPLVPRAYGDYLAKLDAQRLNRLNVKYYLIPQLLPVDEASELYDVHNPFASLPANTWLSLAEVVDVRALTIESYLSHAADLPDGTLAATLVLRTTEGQELALPLRAGIETAEWAYERTDVAAQVAHSRPEIATTWPARSGFPAEDHAGHTYRARWTWDAPLHLEAVMLQPLLPEAFVRVERVRLEVTTGEERLLAHLVGLGDHAIVYRSEDVLIYRNEDALPRAYTLPATAATRAGEALHLPERLLPQDVRPAQVLRYEDTAVELAVTLGEPGYLILADLECPGWRAWVDGAEAPILCADGLFRAVELPAGDHRVRFCYNPWFSLLSPAGYSHRTAPGYSPTAHPR